MIRIGCAFVARTRGRICEVFSGVAVQAENPTIYNPVKCHSISE